MKRIGVSLLALLLLVFFASTIQAQSNNNSADNSVVITEHSSYEHSDWIYCPETGVITYTVQVHMIRVLLPNGTYLVHYNTRGEGTDEDEGAWELHSIWNSIDDYSEGDNHLVRSIIFNGPLGAKLKVTYLLIVKDNEIVKTVLDPLCD